MTAATGNDRRIRNIVIVGGGTAGWMAAAALGKFLQNGYTSIRLIESAAIGTIGVGEATIPPIRNLLAMLRIDENDFVRHTQGTFKLGIEFVDWTRTGHRYMHPFGPFGADIEGVPFHQFWLKQHLQGGAPDIETFSLTATAARQKRFAATGGSAFPLNQWAWAYHFDATQVAAYLRRYAERAGVHRTEGQVIDVSRREPDGFIDAVTLEGGERVAGDLFIDCSGFRGLLIGETLGVSFEDWEQWLPCNRAVAVPSATVASPEPYTRSTALAAGWQWHIPLQHRTGNGYVYCDRHLSDDEAAATLLANLDGDALDEPRFIPFRTGRRKVFWEKNCIALGLAAGFLEPLESTAIHLVQTGVAKLLALFPDRDFAPVETAEYNRLVGANYEQVRDFLVLHYRATERDDSAFWRECRHLDMPESLRHKLDLFTAGGRCLRYEDDLFSVTSWVAVLLGQGIRPRRHDPVVDSLSDAQLAEVLERMRARIAETAAGLPTQEDWIRRHCAATD